MDTSFRQRRKRFRKNALTWVTVLRYETCRSIQSNANSNQFAFLLQSRVNDLKANNKRLFVGSAVINYIHTRTSLSITASQCSHVPGRSQLYTIMHVVQSNAIAVYRRSVFSNGNKRIWRTHCVTGACSHVMYSVVCLYMRITGNVRPNTTNDRRLLIMFLAASEEFDIALIRRRSTSTLVTWRKRARQETVMETNRITRRKIRKFFWSCSIYSRWQIMSRCVYSVAYTPILPSQVFASVCFVRGTLTHVSRVCPACFAAKVRAHLHEISAKRKRVFAVSIDARAAAAAGIRDDAKNIRRRHIGNMPYICAQVNMLYSVPGREIIRLLAHKSVEHPRHWQSFGVLARLLYDNDVNRCYLRLASRLIGGVYGAAPCRVYHLLRVQSNARLFPRTSLKLSAHNRLFRSINRHWLMTGNIPYSNWRRLKLLCCA